MNYFTAYLLIKLDDFINVLIPFSIFGVIVGVVLFFISMVGGTAQYGLFYENEQLKNSLHKLGKKILKITVLCIFFVALIPSTKQMATIYILPSIVNNKDLQETIKQVPELTNLGLQYLKEILTEQKVSNHGSN